MEVILIIIIVIVVIIIWKGKIQLKNEPPVAMRGPNSEGDLTATSKDLPIKGAYQQKWMFTYNEKDAYQKLKPIAEKLGYTIFAKVRLLDLVEPIKVNKKYKTYLWKVQAKHVDFVLCDCRLVAKYIIELDDNSHDAKDRKDRDNFVDEVVESVGYKIIHVRAITDDIINQLQ
jgi:very-short-patch-repair endonuclease